MAKHRDEGEEKPERGGKLTDLSGGFQLPAALMAGGSNSDGSGALRTEKHTNITHTPTSHNLTFLCTNHSDPYPCERGCHCSLSECCWGPLGPVGVCVWMFCLCCSNWSSLYL